MAARKVAILGGGKIGESLLAGLLSSGWREPRHVVVTGRREERVQELAERYGVRGTLSNAEAVAGAALDVIAVKPQDFDGLLGEIGGLLTPEQTVLSVAAAIPTSLIEARVAPDVPVVRAMPNAPALVPEGMAGSLAGGHRAGRHDDPGNPRAGTGRRARRVLECDSSCNGEIARARVGRAVKGRDVELVILEDENEVATVVANRLARAAQEGGNVVLTGGKTPKRAYEQATKTEADWSKVALWWGDERCVPPDDDNSN